MTNPLILYKEKTPQNMKVTIWNPFTLLYSTWIQPDKSIQMQDNSEVQKSDEYKSRSFSCGKTTLPAGNLNKECFVATPICKSQFWIISKYVLIFHGKTIFVPSTKQMKVNSTFQHQWNYKSHVITETENAHKTVLNNWKEYTLQYQCGWIHWIHFKTKYSN